MNPGLFLVDRGQGLIGNPVKIGNGPAAVIPHKEPLDKICHCDALPVSHK
jgi:hypothetical protein